MRAFILGLIMLLASCGGGGAKQGVDLSPVPFSPAVEAQAVQIHEGEFGSTVFNDLGILRVSAMWDPPVTHPASKTITYARLEVKPAGLKRKLWAGVVVDCYTRRAVGGDNPYNIEWEIVFKDTYTIETIYDPELTQIEGIGVYYDDAGRVLYETAELPKVLLYEGFLVKAVIKQWYISPEPLEFR